MIFLRTLLMPLLLAAVYLAVAPAAGETSSTAQCSAHAAKDKSHDQVIHVSLTCEQRLIGMEFFRTTSKRLERLGKTPQIAHRAPNDWFLCKPRAATCRGSVTGGAVLLRAVFHRPVCDKPRPRIKIDATLAPECSGNCPAIANRAVALAPGIRGC